MMNKNMPEGQVSDISALDSDIGRLAYPLGSAGYMSKASHKSSPLPR